MVENKKNTCKNHGTRALAIIGCLLLAVLLTLWIFPGREISLWLNPNGCLFKAVERGDLFEVKSAVEEWKADPYSCNDKSETPLLVAAEKGYLDIVRCLLLNSSSNLLRARDVNKRTALLRAAKNGHRYVVMLLVDAGANVNDRDDRGWTALMYSLKYVHPDFTRFLIGHRADVDYISRDWECVIGERYTAQKLQPLVDAGLDVNALDAKGRTAMTCAIMLRNHEVLRFLHENGGDINRVGQNGRTPLMQASMYGNLYAVLFLVENGADVNAVDGYERDALMLAIEYSDSDSLDIVELLLDHGSSFDTMNKYGQTALKIAIRQGKVDVITYLEGIKFGQRDGALPSEVESSVRELFPDILEEIRDMNSPDRRNFFLELAEEYPEIDVNDVSRPAVLF